MPTFSSSSSSSTLSEAEQVKRRRRRWKERTVDSESSEKQQLVVKDSNSSRSEIEREEAGKVAFPGEKGPRNSLFILLKFFNWAAKTLCNMLPNIWNNELSIQPALSARKTETNPWSSFLLSWTSFRVCVHLSLSSLCFRDQLTPLCMFEVFSPSSCWFPPCANDKLSKADAKMFFHWKKTKHASANVLPLLERKQKHASSNLISTFEKTN